MRVIRQARTSTRSVAGYCTRCAGGAFDAAFMAAADPDTLLFTSAFADEALVESGPLFLDNEFGACRDVNRFVDLARARDPVASLNQVSRGERAASARWREIMGPLGMGDELRVAGRRDRVGFPDHDEIAHSMLEHDPKRLDCRTRFERDERVGGRQP